MTIRTITLLAGAAALLAATPALAASDYYMKLGDIKGESTARDKDHKGWIELESLSWAPERGASATGGVRVATGDVDGDGRAERAAVTAPRDAASGLPTGKRQHKPVTVTKEVDKATPRLAETVSAGEDETEAALLLPAVQKVREAAARMPRGHSCTVGQTYETVEIRKGKDGPVHTARDVTVSACAGEQISLNFTKIEM